ncbi:MAG: succinate dehydrogenase, hydrophobic membrane anchor protein [Gammaproteobacteria bacterium]|nr:succinate dehydrogenase, hydrophobic membrane anchor protein [Gammaproteobacteria bacterium]
MSRQAHGLRAWVLQRFSAVYLLLFLVYLGVHFSRVPVADFTQWHAWFAAPLVNLATGLFILSLLIHAWVGIRDVIMDYVTHTGVRVALFAAVMLTLAGCGLWSLRVLFLTVLSGSGA